jgi:hypothetical protein
MTTNETLIITQTVAIALLFLKALIDSFAGNQSKNTKAIVENTIAITRLDVQISHLNDAVASIKKMEKDINVAHEKIRELQRVTP